MADAQLPALPSLAPARLTDPVYTDRGGGTYGRLSVGDVLALSARRNLVINPAMERDTRNNGSAQALTTSPAYCLDRWAALQVTAAAGIVQRQVTGSLALGFRRCLVLQRNAGSSALGALQVIQVFETADSVRFQGKQITFSAFLRGGANFSAASANVRVILAYGTGTDETVAQFAGAGLTGQVNVLNLFVPIALGGNFVRYTLGTVTIPANATQLAIFLAFTPTGVAGADDSLAITGVSVEPGEKPSDFEFRHEGAEEALCRRFARKMQVYVPASYQSLPIDMRAVPNIAGGGAGYASTGTTADALTHQQTTPGLQTLLLDAEL